MNERTEHRRLYKKIPDFKCKEGCHGCCGPVPISRWEARRIGINEQITPIKPGSLECEFVGENGCTVYENRPLMCRLFGTSSDEILSCPQGCGPDKKLTSQDASKIRDEYINIMR